MYMGMWGVLSSCSIRLELDWIFVFKFTSLYETYADMTVYSWGLLGEGSSWWCKSSIVAGPFPMNILQGEIIIHVRHRQHSKQNRDHSNPNNTHQSDTGAWWHPYEWPTQVQPITAHLSSYCPLKSQAPPPQRETADKVERFSNSATTNSSDSTTRDGHKPVCFVSWFAKYTNIH